MEAVILAGIARRVLDELLRNPYRTIELRSARNVLAIEEAIDEALRLFLTYDPFDDVSTGTEGLLAELIEAKELETRVPWEESDEREITVCRAKVKLVGLGRVVEVERRDGILVARVRELFPHEMSMG
ncbi:MULTISPECIES: DUF473 domain-containing protein [Thermococcus]|uniref:Uncharacterized protein n=1 Tax=Thermococcus nautili TaxID=195522 RepID=W8NVV9_9EURY|nr:MULTISPECIES: DUF473 domain-containing protein [Thermococcus]AHL23418.1 hypothetical protein BD01_1815 [Thermococcus nautili]EEB73564.1 conserved hypothetical protein [Thermococcus sp. AM4]NJE54384.1 DUF473 domain-containing protein [Thermococcus sp. 21S9]